MKKALQDYNKKRNFKITSEPEGKAGKSKGRKLAFCVQKHDATRLHYDFRLELDGVLKSWAVTKGPSFNPQDKRLAVHVEDHPYDYRTFEGVIPEGGYGGGPVMLWDEGTWEPVNDPHDGMKKGHLTFILHGHRMNGEWALIRMKGRPGEKRDNWLLVKAHKDEFVQTEEQSTVYLNENNTSVKTGRTMEEIKNGKVKAKEKTKTGIKKKSEKSVKTSRPSKKNTKDLDRLGKAYPEVQLATLVDHPPMGKDWWHEIKYDGYRILALIDQGNVRIRTRGGLDWTEKFQGIADELAKMNVKSAVLDGEAVVLDEKSASNFSKLKEALSENNQPDIHAFFFDLLHLNGKDYHDKPLSERKPVLDALLNKQSKLTHLHLSEHLDDSENLLPMVCKLGAEGVISKRIDAPYKFKRSKDWLKSKCGQEQEFVIGGFMPSSENPKAIGSLHLGFYKGGKLAYAGKVGTGFTRKLAKELYDALKPLQRKTMPFTDNMPKGERNAVWVEPRRVGQVSFWEWTPDRHIRHASFKGLREDKTPKQVTREVAEKISAPSKPSSRKKEDSLVLDNITITHPNRVMFPDAKVTKGDVARYYHEAMEYVLPFLEKRPISVIRFPGDINGEAFFQRNPMKGVSTDVQPVTFDYKDVKRTYFYIDTPEGLMSLVQMGAIEFHPWGVHVKDVHHPDHLIFDLDPAPDVPFAVVKLAALDMRQRLKNMKLESFVRTTGGKGLHVTVPIKPNIPWHDAKEWTRAFCEQMVEDTPDAYVATMTKAKRGGKIFLDFFRNDYTATAVSPFVIRGRKGAPVAMPVEWKELESIKSASQFTIKNARDRMNAKTRKLIAAQLNCIQKLPL
jgi:bifunctional non-homologous end joining protein LigD